MYLPRGPDILEPWRRGWYPAREGGRKMTELRMVIDSFENVEDLISEGVFADRKAYADTIKAEAKAFGVIVEKITFRKDWGQIVALLEYTSKAGLRQWIVRDDPTLSEEEVDSIIGGTFGA
jgi:hypothetical protein